MKEEQHWIYSRVVSIATAFAVVDTVAWSQHFKPQKKRRVTDMIIVASSDMMADRNGINVKEVEESRP